MKTTLSYDSEEWPVEIRLAPEPSPQIIVSSPAGAKAELVAIDCIEDGRIKLPRDGAIEKALHRCNYALVSASLLARVS